MITLSGAEAGRALGLPALAAPVAGISIDTRSLTPGDLFVALRGERFDGHEFVGAAAAAGASAIIAEEGAALEAVPIRVYRVPDTLAALGALAREVRRKSRAVVFAVTGSAGKTSTKDLLAAMAGQVRRVVATASNQNNQVGVPLTLLRIDEATEAVVVEMGMRGRGEIAALAAVAEPDVGVITNIHPVHLELLGTLENIAQAKAELLEGLAMGGVAVVPEESEVLRAFAGAAGCRVLTFGSGARSGTAEVTACVVGSESGSERTLVLRWPTGEARVETEDLPSHVVSNVAAAAACCYAAGLPMERCAAGIAEVEFSRNRGELIELADLLVVDDTYNANPAAMRAALDNLVRTAGDRGGRPVAVLGDMLELGPESGRFHVEVGSYAATVGVRALWGVGAWSRETVRGFRGTWEAQRGVGEDCVCGHVDSAEITEPVFAGLGAGDVVLFKASRSMRLEAMVERLVQQRGRTRERK